MRLLCVGKKAVFICLGFSLNLFTAKPHGDSGLVLSQHVKVLYRVLGILNRYTPTDWTSHGMLFTRVLRPLVGEKVGLGLI